MDKKIVVSALIAAFVACSGSAYAQDRHEHDDRGPPQQGQRGDKHNDNNRNDRNGGGHAYAQPNKGANHASDRGVGPRHDLHRGNRLPNEYRNRQHYVGDWRGRHLSAPPRGHQWVQVNGDYVLMAVATGLIAQIVLGN